MNTITLPSGGAAPADDPAERRRRRGPVSLLLLALIMILGGGSVAAWVQTDNGGVTIKDTRFIGSGGQELSALLYIPKGASVTHKAPAIMAVHGYINSRETQDAFAIEFARRGYVVLDMDQAGHGFSDAPAFAAGYGGPAGLAYLHGLDIVDTSNIGLEGHSMGGWTVMAAAATYPTYYKSMVLEGSSPGDKGNPAPDATSNPVFPRNLAIVYGTHEEFSQLMYGVANPKDMQSAPKTKAIFNTTATVKKNTVYGSIADGTARYLYRPNSSHAGLTTNPGAVSDAVSWFHQTLQGGHSAGGQIWWLKELGTFLAFIGGILFMLSGGALLLRTPWFAELAGTPAPARGVKSGMPWAVNALIATAIPAVTYFWFQIKAQKWFTLNDFWPQSTTTGVMGWAVGNAAVTLVLFALWHFTQGRKGGGNAVAYGLSWADGFSVRRVAKSAGLAVVTAFGLYQLLAFSNWAFMTDFRLYVLQLHLMDALHFKIFLCYLVPFAVFFLVLGAFLHGQFRPSGGQHSMGRLMLVNSATLVAGILVLLVLDYVPLVTGHTLWVSTQPLLIIVAQQFVPLLIVIGIVSTWFSHKTGTIYAGAFLNAIFITWLIVAGTATEHPVGSWGSAISFLRIGVPLIVAAGLLVLLASSRRAGGRTHRHASTGSGTEREVSLSS